ncbi:MAG: hypothetical protein ACOCUI_00915 [bacterium]
MKQYITVEKLSKLSHKELEKATEIFGSNDDWECDYLFLCRLAKKITIGKMIEILQNDKRQLRMNQSLEGYWRVELDYINGHSFYQKELCDALWEAIKYMFREWKI